MKFITKTLLIISLITVFLVSARSAFAQYPGMAQVRQQMSRDFATQQMNMQMNSMMMFNSPMIPNNKYNYQVKLKDSSKIMVTSKIYNDTSLHKTYLLLVDKSFPKSDMAHRERKIYPDQTLNISHGAYDVHNKAFPYTGMPNDTCWLFKAISGGINGYSLLGELGFDLSFETISGIQKGNGPIVHYTIDNLKTMIAGDPEAMKYFDKKKYEKALYRYNKDLDKAAGK